jgi:hypothetical protein
VGGISTATVTLSYIAASRMSANRNNAAVDLSLSYVGNGQEADNRYLTPELSGAAFFAASKPAIFAGELE